MKYVLLLLSILFFNSSFAQTINWSTPIDVAVSSVGFNYPRIVNNDKGEVFVTYGDSDNIYFSKKSGSTFSSPIQINSATMPAYLADWTGADLAVKGDSIYIVFMHKVWKQKSYISRSFDGGLTFSAPITVENYADSSSRFPTVDVTPNGQPIVAFMKMDTNGHHPHYVVRQSVDYGNTFTNEKTAGAPNSEACDCCPAAIKANGNDIAIYYRNNQNNLRNIHTMVSQNDGSTYSNFVIDNNNWMINACPATGPDGIIIGDSLYAVFKYLNKSYLSSSSMSNAALNVVQQLGATSSSNQQHSPRIDNNGNQVAIVWREQIGTNKLLVSHTENILSIPFSYDTIQTQNFASCDVAVSNNVIHIVYTDMIAGSVKYIQGSKWPSATTQFANNSSIEIYPNPSSDKLFIKSKKLFSTIKIYSTSGKIIIEKDFETAIDISTIADGNYVLELIDKYEIPTRTTFSKNSKK